MPHIFTASRSRCTAVWKSAPEWHLGASSLACLSSSAQPSGGKERSGQTCPVCRRRVLLGPFGDQLNQINVQR